MRRQRPLVAALVLAWAAILLVPEAQEEAAGTAKPVPEDAKRVPNPIPADRVSIGEGRELFEAQCTMCHGREGRGDGDLVARLGMQVPDFGSAAWQKEWTDGAMFYVLSEGHGRMPAQKTREGKQRFDEESRWHLVNFIRSLGPS